MILENFIPYLEIVYTDTKGFPDAKSISKELIQDLDFDEDWAWSTAAVIIHYRKMDKEFFIRMLHRGVRIKLSEDLEEVVKDHLEKYPVVDVNDERGGMLLKIEAFTTNDMFIK